MVRVRKEDYFYESGEKSMYSVHIITRNCDIGCTECDVFGTAQNSRVCVSKLTIRVTYSFYEIATANSARAQKERAPLSTAHPIHGGAHRTPL